MSQPMMPKSVQSKIIELYIAYQANTKLNDLKCVAHRDKSNIDKQIESFKITISDELEAQRVSYLTSLKEEVEKTYQEKAQTLNFIIEHIHEDIPWNLDATGYTSRYETTIHVANMNGSEIYDSCMIFSGEDRDERLNKLMELCLLIANKHAFKVKFEAIDADNSKTLKMYTTSLGMGTISESLKKQPWIYDGGVEMYFYALPLDAQRFDDLSVSEIKDGRNSILDNVAILRTGSNIFSEKYRYDRMGRMFSIGHTPGIYPNETHHWTIKSHDEFVRYYPVYDAEFHGNGLGYQDMFKAIYAL